MNELPPNQGQGEPSPAATTATPAANEDKLQQEIERLLAELETSEECGVFRGLCQLAVQAQIDPEHFRVRLVRARLRTSRASEIKAVLLCPPVCLEFLQHQRSWKKALSAARQKTSDPLACAAASLIKQVTKYGLDCLDWERKQHWDLSQDEHGQFFFVLRNRGTLEMIQLNY